MQKRSHHRPARRKPDASSRFDLWSARGDAKGESLERTNAFQRAILAIPAGKVSTYGKVAEAAGYPRHHRGVARLLSQEGFEDLPWHRVVSADGTLKTSGASASEQRARLRLEGVRFEGNRIKLNLFLHKAEVQ